MSIRISPFCRKDRISPDQNAMVYLRFTINRTSRYVSTGIKVPVAKWDFDKQKPQRSMSHIQYQIYEHIERYQKQIRRLEALDIDVTFDNVLGESKKTIGCTVAEYLTQIIEQTEHSNRLSSASRYKVILSQLKQARLANVRFEDINLNYIDKFETLLVKLGNRHNSIATKMSVLKSIYNKALTNKLFICRDNPFLKYNIGKHKEQTRKRAITKDDILTLSVLPLPKTKSPYTELSRDLFLFSYFSAGINFKDIAMLRYGDVVDNTIFYCRKKTKKKMACRLLPQAQTIIHKYIQANKEDDDYIFPILDKNRHKTVIQIANRLHKTLAIINRELNNWGIRLGLKTKLTTYVARHTYATVLKRSGVDIAIISETLGHSEISTTQIYLDSFENSQIDEAMKCLV